jgi:CDP-L-myo-inositol myo-inositolphosphotransferase
MVLAAGRGARLGAEDLPKPLVQVAGLTLLGRTLRTLWRAGVRRVVVVVGHRADEVRAGLERARDLDALDIALVENREFDGQNGLSVLVGAALLRDERFFLTMSDHVFDASIVRALAKAGTPRGGLSLAVDRHISTIFDIDDATKVAFGAACSAGVFTIAAIGKSLERFDAADTGVFLATRGLVDALAEVRGAEGDASLSDGVTKLARNGLANAVDVSGALWQDVDTPETKREAERRLFASLRKREDGIVSRHLNRFISIAISRVLCRTSVRPNHVTMVTFAVGIAAALAASAGTWAFTALGGFLYQWKSILDGVDGELARLKLEGSALGAWLDTLVDDFTNWAFYAGVALGAWRASGEVSWLWLGAAAVLFAIIVSVGMYRWIWTRKRTGDLLAFEWFWESRRTTLARAPANADGFDPKLLVKQDFFVFLFFLLALANVVSYALYAVAAMGIVLSVLLAIQFAREARSARRVKSANSR